MKKIIGAAAAGLALTGAAFAEYSVTGNVRFEADVFGYESPSRSERPDKYGSYNNGDVTWATQTKYNDDITLQASGDNVGAKIVFNVSSNIDGNDSTSNIKITSYQGWAKDLFGIRLDVGAYDTRIGKELHNGGDWQKNLSGTNKPGIWLNFAGGAWGKDATNISTIKGAKTYTNFQVSKSGLLDGKLTVRGVLFTYSSGTNANDADYKATNDNWIFTPFALGAVYAPDKTSQLAFNAKLSSIKKSKVTSVTSGTTTTVYTVPDTSIWTLNAEYYKKLDSGIEVQAGYTLGMALYSDWSGEGAHWKKTTAKNKADNGTRDTDFLVRDNDMFIHGIDFRVKNIKLMDALSLTAVTGINYIQGTAVQKKDNRDTPTGTSYKDARAKSYAKGAAGELGYWASVSLDYAQSDTITLQLQTKIGDDNLFDTESVNGKEHVDYFNDMQWYIRPGVIVKLEGTSVFFAGVQFLLEGFQQNATGSANTFKTTTTVPVGMRIRL